MMDLFDPWKGDPKERARYMERMRYARNRDKMRKKSRAFYVRHRSKELERCKKYRNENPETVKAVQKKWLTENRETRAKIVNNYIKNREKNDPEFRMLRKLRSRLRRAVKQGERNTGMEELIGCSLTELRLHLQRKFKLGMTWENHGTKGWHIDHITPLSKFDLTDEIHLRIACHYTNLQPLWWYENLKKGNR